VNRGEHGAPGDAKTSSAVYGRRKTRDETNIKGKILAGGEYPFSFILMTLNRRFNVCCNS